MAESGEAGEGRMAEPLEIVAAIEALLDTAPQAAGGQKIIVTSGPTHEPIDPVRYIANRSSGKQGHAIAAALARLGADVRLVSGPVAIPDPAGVKTVHVERAEEMRDAVEQLLPADAAVFVAAVADWRTAGFGRREDQEGGRQGRRRRCRWSRIRTSSPASAITRSGPISSSASPPRPQNLLENAAAKLKKKGADLIVANDVSQAAASTGGVMGGDRNRVRIVSKSGVDEWPDMTKDEVAARLAALIAERLKTVAVTV